MRRESWTANQQFSETRLPFVCNLTKAISVKTMLFDISCCLKKHINCLGCPQILASEIDLQQDNQNIKGLLIWKTTRCNGVFLFPIENVHFRLHMFHTAVEKLGWFAIFQWRIIYKHFYPNLKIPVLSNQCQCKIAFAACNFCQNTSFRQIETKPIV